jgi:hypothetical protein
MLTGLDQQSAKRVDNPANNGIGFFQRFHQAVVISLSVKFILLDFGFR